MFKNSLKFLAIIFVVAIVAVGGYFYYEHQVYYPSTDDAYVQANIICIAPRVNGMVKQVYVQNQQYVRKGQPLFNIDPKPYQLAVQKAQSELDNIIQQVRAAQSTVIAAKALVAQRETELITAKKTYHRIITLVNRNLSSKASGDEATNNLKVAKAALQAAQSQLEEAKQKLGDPGDANAQVRAAKAELAQAQLNLQYTHVIAPADGYIAKYNLQHGQVVSAYQDLFSLVKNNNWWVDANYKETDLNRIKPGQTATITVDIYPHHQFKGIVKSISPSSGSVFSLLPPENATGNWVKVTQRFPVRIKILNPSMKYPLRAGASSAVTINTK